MADDDATAAPDTATAAPDQKAAAPTMKLVGQYIKDLSFENPGAPGSILAGGANPVFNVQISVGIKKQSDDTFAVELTLNAKADRDAKVLFQVELIYGGVFQIRNVPDQQLTPLLMIECPRLIFPFARQVLASVTQQGGFPPLMMEPVDFQAIYRQNVAALAARQQQAGAQGAPGGMAPPANGPVGDGAAPSAGDAPTDKPN